MRKKISEQKRKSKHKKILRRRRMIKRRKKRISEQMPKTHHNKILERARTAHQNNMKKIRMDRLNWWKFVYLLDWWLKIINNVSFLNSQNYISSSKKDFRLFYYSKEKRKNYNKSKILISKIEVDNFEKIYIKFHNLIWFKKKTKWYTVHIWTKFLYLVKNKK